MCLLLQDLVEAVELRKNQFAVVLRPRVCAPEVVSQQPELLSRAGKGDRNAKNLALVVQRRVPADGVVGSSETALVVGLLHRQVLAYRETGCTESLLELADPM